MMEKIFKLSLAVLVFVLSVFVLNTPVAAQNTKNLSAISLGQSRQDVEKSLGKSLKVTERDELTILWYQSVDPSFADFGYFKDGYLVMKSVSIYNGNQSLSEFVSKYGPPEKSVAKYAANIEDSLQIAVHIWSQSGVSVQTIGTDMTSKVVRVMIFTPLSLDSFFQVLGRDLLGNQVISVKTAAPENISNPNTGVSQKLFEVEDSSINIWLSLAAGVSVIIGLFITIRLLRRKTEQKTS